MAKTGQYSPSISAIDLMKAIGSGGISALHVAAKTGLYPPKVTAKRLARSRFYGIKHGYSALHTAARYQHLPPDTTVNILEETTDTDGWSARHELLFGRLLPEQRKKIRRGVRLDFQNLQFLNYFACIAVMGAIREMAPKLNQVSNQLLYPWVRRCLPKYDRCWFRPAPPQVRSWEKLNPEEQAEAREKARMVLNTMSANSWMILRKQPDESFQNLSPFMGPKAMQVIL